MEPTRLRPLQVGEILDAAMKVYRQRFASLCKAAFVVVAPVEILIVLIQLSIPDDAFVTDEFGDSVSTTADVAAGVGSAFIVVLAFASVLLVMATTLRIVHGVYLDRPVHWTESLTEAIRKLPSLAWIVVLYTACALAGLPYCGIPTVYVYVAFVLAVPVLMLEGTKGARALHRSRRLVEGRWWPVAGVLLASIVLMFIVRMLFNSLILGAGSTIDDLTVAILVGTVLQIIGSVLIEPFFAVVITILYFDMRVRKEGFDLELLAGSIGSG